VAGRGSARRCQTPSGTCWPPRAPAPSGLWSSTPIPPPAYLNPRRSLRQLSVSPPARTLRRCLRDASAGRSLSCAPLRGSTRTPGRSACLVPTERLPANTPRSER
jgi:hypothetical protein